MSNTIIRSNNGAVIALANIWAAMVELINEYKHTGRGFLFYPQGSSFMDYMGLDELKGKGFDGQAHLGIEDDLYQQLIEVVEDKYTPEGEFVFVTRQEIGGKTKFVVNIGSLAVDGWKEHRSPEDIRRVEAEKQKFAAKRRLELMKQQRIGGKKR
jgi:hypothetical protein